MSEQNEKVLKSVLGSIDDFVRNRIGIEDVQVQLRSSANLLERESGGVLDAIRLAEADLEEIQFTMLLDEQRPAAVFRLDELREVLIDRLGKVQ